MITREGHVKLLDFGLAKQTERASVAAAEATVDTVTHPGTVLGTSAYMSPEQARGQAVGFRSDLFSFGLVLCEMAWGKKAFARDSAPQTLAAIIGEEAPPLEAKLPAPLRLPRFPGIDGRHDIPAVFDGVSAMKHTAVPLKLKSVEQRKGDALWIRYEVIRP